MPLQSDRIVERLRLQELSFICYLARHLAFSCCAEKQVLRRLTGRLLTLLMLGLDFAYLAGDWELRGRRLPQPNLVLKSSYPFCTNLAGTQ